MAECEAVAVAPDLPAGDALFSAPWSALDDSALFAHFRGARQVWVEPIVDPDETRRDKIDALLSGRFEFNGESHTCAGSIDWLVNPSADVEWHILLHKFYYAVGLGLAWRDTRDARYAQRWMQLIDGWMRVTPPGFIAADVTGRRVQNWIYSLHYVVFIAPLAPLEADFLRRLLHSIHLQVEFLCANLTPKRNHRTLELLAIFLAGVVFPEFKRAAHWRAFALAQTLENMRADLLPDGVHCELSTDYHHLALRNWLQVRQLAARNGIAVPAAMDALLEGALEFSQHAHKPDGIVPSLSDGDARCFLDLLRQGAELYQRDDMRYVATRGQMGTPPARRVAHFDAAGYSIVRSGWDSPDAQYLILDCGPLGEGNHGHFDALSFELAAFGKSLIVDPGRYTYSEAGATNWRVHFRSTAAHNTVCVDGCNQTRYVPKPIKEASRHAVGSVRHKIAGPAPDNRWVERVASDDLDLLHGRCASHEYDAVHERCVVFVDCRYWIVCDWLRAESEHDYVLNFQLSASAQERTSLTRDACTLLRSPGLLLAQPVREGAVASLAPGWVSARYGYKSAAPAFRNRAHGRNIDFDTVLVPWRDHEPQLDVDRLRLETQDGTKAHALGIRLQCDGRVFQDCWFHARSASAVRWRHGPLEFHGRWLHWREDPDGQMIRAISHAGAKLNGPHGPLPLLTVGTR